MSNKGQPPMRPGIPMGATGNQSGSVDAGMPTALEISEAEARKRAAREDSRPVDERIADRYASIDEARGGGRDNWNNAEWDEAAGPTDPEKRQRIRDVLNELALPNLPRKDGFHRCWVSTTHNIDTPQRRLRLGYFFYKLDDARKEQWHADEYAVNDASSVYKGCIMWREMIAMEISQEDYVMIMREVHHDRPMDQARSIYDSLEAAGQQIRDMGGRTTMAPGMETLRQFTRPPRQFE